jgi:transposase
VEGRPVQRHPLRILRSADGPREVLFFSAGGFVVYYKRLERGRFSMPRIPEGASQIVLEPGSLAMLLDGIDLRAVRRTTMWQPTTRKSA